MLCAMSLNKYFRPIRMVDFYHVINCYLEGGIDFNRLIDFDKIKTAIIIICLN